MNWEKRMNNCETEKNYICHSERAVATEESIWYMILVFPPLFIMLMLATLPTYHPITLSTISALRSLTFERSSTLHILNIKEVSYDI